MKNYTHTSVLLDEVISQLNVSRGKKYIDATLGGGGHTKEILTRGGIVLGIDQDKDAIENAQKENKNTHLTVSYGNFKDIEKIAKANDFNHVSGVIFDLGVSSYQLDTGERGFSIRVNGELDMRMDTENFLTAKEIVNTYSEDALREIFITYGEEDHARKIAEEIVNVRKERKIQTTYELTAIIKSVVKRTGKLHPATKVFQALRIEVNDELGSLRFGLQGAYELLERHGRIIVITFHSLEDRIVKRTFDTWEKTGFGNAITKKPIVAAENELLSNPRARSAKLRVFEKK